MKKPLHVPSLLALALSASLQAQTAPADRAGGGLLQVPLAFVPDAEAGGFTARGDGYIVRALAEGIDLHLRGAGGSARIGLRFSGSRAGACEPAAPLPGRSHFFLGNDPCRWRTDVPHHGQLRRRDVWPGVDAVIYGNQRRLEYDFVVAPGGDPDAIRISFEGVGRVEIERDGGLSLQTALGAVRQLPPVAWQDAAGTRTPVAARHVLDADGTVGFELDGYDPDLPLVIDPIVTYASFLGGSGTDAVVDVAVDANGDVLLVGDTLSVDYPTVGPAQAAIGGLYDVFVAKVSAGGALLWSTYLGGTTGYQDREVAHAIAADGSGGAVVTGRTNATDFPLRNAWQPALGGDYDAFVTRFDAQGRIVWSTYLGGSARENTHVSSTTTTIGGDLLVDALGQVLVSGTTFSTDFPTTPGCYQAGNAGFSDAFVARMDLQGGLLAATLLGGGEWDECYGMTSDAGGSVYLVGEAGAQGFPTTPGAFSTAASDDGFAARLDPSLQALLWSTRWFEAPTEIALDAAGDVYLGGWTGSVRLPVTPGAHQLDATSNAYSLRIGDTWIAKLAAGATGVVWATYYGISNRREVITDLEVDATGHPYFTMVTYSGPSQSTTTMSSYLVKLDNVGSAVCFQERIGPLNSSATAMQLAPNDTIWVAGAAPPGLATTPGAFQPASAGGADGCLVKLVEPAGDLVSVTVLAPALTRGRSETAALTLDGPAPAGGAVVSLAVQPAGAATVPATVVVPPGSSTATFTVQVPVRAPLGPTRILASTAGRSVDRPVDVVLPPAYRVVNLGQLQPGPFSGNSEGHAVNVHGDAVGLSRANSQEHGFFHSGGSIRDVGVGVANDVNDAGQVTFEFLDRPYVWTAATGRTALPTLAFATYGSFPNAINNLGHVVGMASSYVEPHAFFYDGQRVIDLGIGLSVAHDVNDRDWIVGSMSAQGRAFLWRQGVTTDLGVLPGHSYAEARGINFSGQVTGHSAQQGYGVIHAFRWEPGTGMQDLGVLPGNSKSTAYGINAHGHVVGDSEMRAFLFTDAAGMRELRPMLDTTDWIDWTELRGARGINDLGQIVGTGVSRRTDYTIAACRLDPLWFEPYGRGCPGSAGVPALAGSGVPEAGNTIALHVARCAPQALVALALGTQRQSLPLPGGCTLEIGSSVALTPAMVLDADGELDLSLPLPAALLPGSVMLQAFVLDPGAANGVYASSNAIELRIL